VLVAARRGIDRHAGRRCGRTIVLAVERFELIDDAINHRFD